MSTSASNPSTAPFRIVVLISGRGSNLRALAEAARHPASGFEIAAVISDNETAAGLEFAERAQIETMVVTRRRKERSNAQFNVELADAASRFSPQLVVLAGFMRILTSDFIERFPGKVINIHPSLLPAFPGLDVQQAAIDAGVCFSGCTVHYVTEEVDAGPIIAQAVVPVLPGDTKELLADRILRTEHLLLPRVVGALARGEISLKDGTRVERTTGVPEGDRYLLSLPEK